MKRFNYYFLAAPMLFLLTSLMSVDNLENNNSTDAHIKMTIIGIRAPEGIMQIGAFMDDKGFKDEKSTYAFKFDKEIMSGGSMTVTFDLPPDVYGFSLMDDENDNNVMDYNFFGIPKEGFGFGDYYHSGYTKPHFDKFKMELKPGETKEIIVKMRYVL